MTRNETKLLIQARRFSETLDNVLEQDEVDDKVYLEVAKLSRQMRSWLGLPR